jgi:catechol 2,3-dioxygenase-like lactoylglutathione lyase family enzyme
VSAVHYLSAFAELDVADIDASMEWYRRVLGFKGIAWVDHDSVHVRRAEGQDLVLHESTSATGGGVTVNFAIDSDLAQLAASVRGAGEDATYRPARTDGMPEALELTDPDGHRLRVFARQVPTARL